MKNAFLIIAILLCMQNALAFAQSNPLKNDPSFDKDYADFIDRYLRSSRQSSSDTAKLSLKQLSKNVELAIQRNNIPQAITLIDLHRQSITDKIDSPESLALIEITLQYNLSALSSHFVEYAQQYGGSFINANILYAQGIKAFEQQNYQQTLEYLSKIDAGSALSHDRRDYATILFGISLQHLRKHRESFKIYKRIDSKSNYYPHAQLNLAVAYIRQGWWTDAQIAIEKARKHPAAETKPELLNRLYVVLGYSQLKNEFYRHARTTFRNVNLDSQYMHRALLGLGLCALSQKDYLGALNAFDRLKKITEYDLTIAEANLLVPFTIERMQKLETASAGYSEAIAYFNNKVRVFENYQVNDNLTVAANDPASGILQALPEHLVNSYLALEQMQAAVTGSTLQSPAASLFSRMKNKIKRERQQQIDEHTAALKSYLSQSQYGFAKLYDENQ